MKTNWLNHAFDSLTDALKNCIMRFPVTVAFVALLTIHLIYIVNRNGLSDKQLMLTLTYYLSVGTLLSLTLHLWSEEMKKRAGKWITHLAGHALLIADAFFLYHITADYAFTEILIAHAAGILAVGLSVFFLSFFKEKNDIPSWNFTLHCITSLAVSLFIGWVMAGGICLLVFSLHALFDMHIGNKCFLYIAILCGVSLSLLLFLGQLPQGARKHNRQPLARTFLNGIIHYLFLPLTAGYLIVLYVYAIRILVNWELPTGWVSWLVVALMVCCLAIEFGLYPTRIGEGKKWDNAVARWLPVLILPLLLLMTIGIIRRFNDYGVTINRLYLITLNGWFYIVCIGLFVIRAKRISWIPISFSVLFLLTSVLPVNFASYTRKFLLSEVSKLMDATYKGKLPLSYSEYQNWLETLPEEQARQINEKLIYIDHWFGEKSYAAVLETEAGLYNRFWYEEESVSGDEPDTDNPSAQTAEARPELNLFYCIDSDSPVEIPAGFARFIPIDSDKYEKGTVSVEQFDSGTLSIPVRTPDTNRCETIDFDTEVLKTLSRDGKKSDRKLLVFRCQSPNCLFVLTSFAVNPDESDSETLTFSYTGYLFQK